MKSSLITSILLGVLAVAAPAAHAAPGPTDTVRLTVDAVIATLSDTGLDEDARRSRVYSLITAQFNFPGMAKRILATNWKKASGAQRQRFVALFTQILANTYWSRIKDYSGEHVEYVGERIKNDKLARVRTEIVTARQRIPVDYSLHKKNGAWRAHDVSIEGVSLVRNYRSSYQQIARKEGIDGLLEKMARKVAEQDG